MKVRAWGVGAQVPATDVDDVRGMAAETGSNPLPRALAGLLVASLLGAAVFGYGRRRLV